MAMELTDEFEVPLAIGAAWGLLTDLERIAPCMPGARLDEVVDGEYRGVVRVKVGPITVEYKGTATFEELDEAAHKLVLKAVGRETRGQGNASATVTATLLGEGGSTKVELHTDLEISGKVAQFGRGVLADVSSKLLGQFVRNIERDLIAASDPPREDLTVATPVVTADDGPSAPSDTEPGAAATTTVPPAPATPPSAARYEPEPLNAMSLVGGSIAKKVLPGFILLLVAAIIRRVRRKRRNT